MKKPLEGKNILVTGASKGLGRACALQLASLGATVYLMARTVRLLEQLYDQILECSYPEPVIIPWDLARATDTAYPLLCERLLEIAPLDGILHAAAPAQTFTPMLSVSKVLWDEHHQVLLRAPWMFIRNLLPVLRQAPNPRIVFIGCHNVPEGAFTGLHCAFQHARSALVQALNQELEHENISIHEIDPGVVHSDRTIKLFPGHASVPQTPEAAAAKIIDYFLKP